MLFCSQQFVAFFAVVFAAYWILPWPRARVWLLLVASYVFYASWNSGLAILICFTTVVDYWLARGIDAASSPRLRKALLAVSVVGNLGLLAYFKYANFFLRSLESALHAAGAQAALPVLSVILPIGISFYTFEAINYTVDVYRRRIPAERSLPDFLLFILFFPHMIAGPIVRAADFLPQIRRPKRWSWLRANLGVQLLILGVFKKLAIADRMAIFADPVFADPTQFRTTALWMATFAYALQVYCDFSGYSDIALGTAHLLGYKLAQNFNAPFAARNIADFWRRWHMSLGSWFRDYLFVPLGGSRGSEWTTARNYLIVFTLCGLWHGANWPMVAWGALHGLMLIVHRHFHRFCERRPRLAALWGTPWGTASAVALTIAFFCASLVVFRNQSLGAAGQMFVGMAFGAAGRGPPINGTVLAFAIGVVAIGHVASVRARWPRWVAAWPSPIRGLALAATMSVALLLAPAAGQAFIYFHF